MLRAAAIAALALAAVGTAHAQQQPAPAEPFIPLQQSPLPEQIQIGLSTDRISITSDFSGADLTIFGAIENADLLLARQGRYDVVVVLEGPTRPVVVRRKDRVLGMWINTDSETFTNVPTSYAVSTTRVYQDITGPDSYRQLSLGPANIYLAPLEADRPAPTIEEFRAALRERKLASGLYNERIGGVQFLSQNLFRATVRLAPNVPVGSHRARAFLFRNGVFLDESSATLGIYKAGFEESIHAAAHDYSFFYGLFAVALAVVTGWVGSIVFRRE
ncbi:MAG TPA: TIGR02186 family protein [Rhizobiaceae bacterium]|nr:TIGR02186 family protein [Rhizobiaceae bacterium]